MLLQTRTNRDIHDSSSQTSLFTFHSLFNHFYPPPLISISRFCSLATTMAQPHFLLVTFPAQGHINPALQFAKRLISLGARVTFANTVYAHRRIANNSTYPDGLSFVSYSDGYDDGFKSDTDLDHYMSEMKRRGSETLRDLIHDLNKQGQKITCLVYTLLLSWTTEVAREFHIPSALLWIQAATLLDIYYYYFTGYYDIINNSESIKLPGLPLLGRHDLPSFLDPSNSYAFALPAFEEQIETLNLESNPKVLVNTFDELEPEALHAMENLNLIAIGPLIPSAFLDGKDPSDMSFGGDMFQSSKNYVEWLNSKPKSSVIYVSFGSISVLPKHQMEQLARGLLGSGRPFLLVIRVKENGEEEEKISCIQELEQHGMIVPWCCQVEVLSNTSVGCFVSHCGWNSTFESLASGVPVVAFPQWSDQKTNAKLVEDVWKTGVRVMVNEEGIVEGDEIKRCLELVMGEGGRGEEIRKNALKWRDLAIEAAKEGGSSEKNLRVFVDEVVQGFWYR